MSAVGWYGPLIDLSSAESHLDDGGGGFVQLLVFVRHSQPILVPPFVLVRVLGVPCRLFNRDKDRFEILMLAIRTLQF